MRLMQVFFAILLVAFMVSSGKYRLIAKNWGFKSYKYEKLRTHVSKGLVSQEIVFFRHFRTKKRNWFGSVD